MDHIMAEANMCCPTCGETASDIAIPQGCTGTRGQYLQSHTTHVLAQLSQQTLPFVFKNNQTFSRGATHVVSNREDLPKLKDALSSRILPKLLAQVTPSNAHLKPATLVVSEMVEEPIGNWALTFFVTEAGKCLFLGATQQMVGPTKSWTASTIAYKMQVNLQQKFQAIMEEIGIWLRKHRYYGPCGADILEIHPAKAEQEGLPALQIVDLNVRTSASLILGLLRGHFSERRALNEASLLDVTVKMSREAFIRKFEESFGKGEIVIVYWWDEIEPELSAGNVIIGARNKLELEKQVGLIMELTC